MHAPCLQWVKINEEVHHVSDFAHLPAKQRPDVFCPACNQPVLLKLGQIRVHHAAHYEGAICVAATQPETVIHLNAKYHIKQELSAKKRLQIWQGCKGWSSNGRNYKCVSQNKRVLSYVENWDHVETEWQYGNYRLDVALLKNKQVIGAIEVFVTHKSDESKLAYLNEQGVAWIEIKVGDDFYTPPTQWKAETPLEPLGCNFSLFEEWQCSDCAKAIETTQNHLDEQEHDLKEGQPRLDYVKQFETKFLRIIDFYYPSQKKYRQIYEIQIKAEQDKIAYASLNELDYKNKRYTRRQIKKLEYTPNFDMDFKKLKSFLEVELKNKNKSWLIDDSKSWFPAPRRFHPKQFMDVDKFPYNFQLENNHWKKVDRKRNIPSDRFKPHYFIPKDPNAPTEDKSPETSETENALAFLVKEYPCEKCGEITSDWIQLFGKTKTCICRKCANNSS